MSSFMILLYWFSESWQHKIDSFGFRSLWFESGVSCSNDDKASIKKAYELSDLILLVVLSLDSFYPD
jgi:hypothetical protein